MIASAPARATARASRRRRAGTTAAATSGSSAESGPKTRIRDGPNRKYATRAPIVAYRPATAGSPPPPRSPSRPDEHGRERDAGDDVVAGQPGGTPQPRDRREGRGENPSRHGRWQGGHPPARAASQSRLIHAQTLPRRRGGAPRRQAQRIHAPPVSPRAARVAHAPPVGRGRPPESPPALRVPAVRRRRPSNQAAYRRAPQAAVTPWATRLIATVSRIASVMTLRVHAGLRRRAREHDRREAAGPEPADVEQARRREPGPRASRSPRARSGSR